MEQKSKEAKSTKNKKKKYKTMKRYSLCFPFHINIKIINEQNLILDLLNQAQIQSNFSQKTKTLSFGLNTCLNLIQKNNSNEILIFIFYTKKMETLYDFILYRANSNLNVHVYFISENWRKNFVEKFRLKQLLGFALIKNDINKDAFNTIKNKIESYDLNDNKNKIISKNNIQETIVEMNN